MTQLTQNFAKGLIFISAILLVAFNSRAQEKIKIYAATDSLVKVTGGEEYAAGKFKRLWLGDHYRDAWTKQITVPYLDLNTTHNGLTPTKLGGGRQTTSLRFEASDGREFVFRSINKNPRPGLDYMLRESVVGDFLQDQTSTQHPYGAIVIADLLDHTDILHAHPKLYVLPDDPALGEFRTDLANLYGTLEERTVAGPDKIVSTVKLIHELQENPSQTLDYKNFAKARMFDILVGDWSKHEDNWKWGQYNLDTGKLFMPIPRDRDHVFSQWDGIIPWIGDREWAIRFGENFDYTINDMRSLTWQSRHMDRFLANELTRADWVSAAREIQNDIADVDIDNAISLFPSGIREISGDEIAAKLKTRRLDLPVYAERYYELLAREVEIVGTDKKEVFWVTYEKDSVMVTVTSNKGALIYQRTFYPSETREIRLFGLKGEDLFKVDGSGRNEIVIRIVGGYGVDDIQIENEVLGKNILIYDKGVSNDSKITKGVKKVNSKNIDTYKYDITRFAYNTYLPIGYVSYNSDNGLGLNLGVSFVNHKYDKPEFSSKHSISAGATTQGNFDIEYTGTYRYFIGKWDLEVNAVAGFPDKFENFFGTGNNTIKNDVLFDEKYYRSRFNTYQAGIGLKQEIWQKNYLSFNIRYEHFNPERQANTLLSTTPSDAVAGLNPLHIVTTGFEYDMDYRDKKSLPENGIRFYMRYHHGFSNDVNFNNGYDQVNGTLEYYISTKSKQPITLGLKAGGGTSNNDIPYYKKDYLGQNANLHGYVKNRFTGKSNAFINSEIRWQILAVRKAFVPYKLGVRGIFDMGRVFDANDTSGNWHKGYGAGFYFVPISEKFTFNMTVAFSEEESGLLLFTIGSFL